MASGAIAPLTTTKIITVQVEVTNSGGFGYYGDYNLTASDLDGAKVAVPLYARATGIPYCCAVGIENNVTVRVSSPQSFATVNVGILLIYY